MSKKKILIVSLLGILFLSLVMISIVRADCSASVTCADGGIAWCEGFGENTSCIGVGGTVTCSGGGITRRWHCPPAR
jgi:hypothetical protein